MRIFFFVTSLILVICAATSGAAGQSFVGVAPAVLEANRGQSHRAVRFLSRGSHDVVLLESRGLALGVNVAQSEGAHATFRMDLVRPSAATAWSGEGPLAGRINYLFGKDPKGWVTNVETFSRVRAENVWAGVDLIYSLVDGGRIRFDFEVSPTADYRQIQLAFPGAKTAIVSGEEVRIENDAMQVRISGLLAFQTIDGRRVVVDAAFERRGQSVGFRLGAYDPRHPVTIDPTIDYTTYLGGDGLDGLYSVALDATEAAYMGGQSNPLTAFYPTTSGAYQAVPAVTGFGAAAGVVTKVDPAQTGAGSLVYSTFLGGTTTGVHDVSDLDIDASGRAYLAGRVPGLQTSDFPTTTGAQQENCNLSQTYAAILSADGGSLEYSTCVHNDDTRLYNVAVHPNGNLILVGVTTRFTGTVAGTNHTGWDVLMMRMDPTAAAGSQWPYESTIGGVGTERVQDIELDSQGRLVLVTPTGADAPTTAGVYQPVNVDTDLYIAKVDLLQPRATSLIWATYFGGAGRDDSFGGGNDAMTIDAMGNVYVGTNAPALPTTAGTISQNPANTAAVFKLGSNGQQLLWSTYLDLTAANIRAIGVGSAGEIVVSGRGANNLPLSTCAVETNNSSVYVARINASASAYEYATYLPGDNLRVEALRVGDQGAAFVVGRTDSNGTIPIVGGAQTVNQGDGDAIFQKIGTASSCNMGPCGAVTFAGECNGTVLSFCEDAGTAFEQLRRVDCASEAFPSEVAGVCTLIDPLYGYDCAVAENDQCSFTDEAGDALFGLCDGTTPGCVIDPAVGTASCQPGIGTCDEATFAVGCVDTYLFTECQVVQPVAFDCSGLGATCTGTQCTGVIEGQPCDPTTLICDPALVCHDRTDSCQLASSICEVGTFENSCSGTTLEICAPRTGLIQNIDCAMAFEGRGQITCGVPFTCIDDGNRGCDAIGVGCVGAVDDDECDVSRNVFCGPSRSCIYGRDAAGAFEGRCQSSSNFSSCAVGTPHVGCEGDIATFCIGNDGASAVEPAGFDCAAVGSTCSVEGDEPVCIGEARAGCQDPLSTPSTLFRCADGFQCMGAVGTILGTCVEEGAPTDGGIGDGSVDDGGTGTSDGGTNPPDTGVPPDPPAEDGCGCEAGRSQGRTWTPILLAGVVFVLRRRVKKYRQ